MRNLLSALGCILLSACSLYDANTTEAAEDPSVESDLNSATLPGIGDFPGSKVFMPPRTPAPGIIMLHGSEGGSAPFIQDFAKQVARSGFVVVTMCWFGCPHKPARIERIPLESVTDIGAWLARSSRVAGGRVGLFGWSRGAEMSLLLTSLVGTHPFKAVAVHAPSDTVVAGFDPATAEDPPDYGGIIEVDPQTGQRRPAPAWTWRGQPLFGEPKPDWSVPGPKIAVEQYRGPVYVSQGVNDEVWDVSRGRHVVAERNAVPGLVTESHFFPGEGHVFQRPSDRATEEREIVSFFRRKLSP